MILIRRQQFTPYWYSRDLLLYYIGATQFQKNCNFDLIEKIIMLEPFLKIFVLVFFSVFLSIYDILGTMSKIEPLSFAGKFLILIKFDQSFFFWHFDRCFREYANKVKVLRYVCTVLYTVIKKENCIKTLSTAALLNFWTECSAHNCSR